MSSCSIEGQTEVGKGEKRKTGFGVAEGKRERQGVGNCSGKGEAIGAAEARNRDRNCT